MHYGLPRKVISIIIIPSDMKRAVRWAKTIFMILFILGTITLGHGIARWEVGAPPSTPGPEDVLDAIYNTSSTVVEWEINWTTEDGTTSTRGIVLTESNAITGVSRVVGANGGFRGVKTVRWNGRATKIRGSQSLEISACQDTKTGL